MTGVLLMVACSILVALGAALLKRGADAVDLARPGSLANAFVVGGVLVYLASFALNVVAFRSGDLVALTPIIELSLVWNLAVSVLAFREKVTRRTIAGTLLVLAGTIVMAFQQ